MSDCMKRYFLTHIVPKDKILEYKVSSAACNFSYNLMSGGAFDATFSVLPAYVQGEKGFPADGDVEYVYSSWRWRGRILRKLAPIRENYSLFRRIESGSSVWLYNMTMLNVWLVLLLRWFKPSVKINVIVLDFTPGEKYNDFFLRQINKCHGRILLANSPLFKKENAVVLPGVTPKDGVAYPIVEAIKKEFLISGVLSENIAMLSMLLPAFSKLPDCTLHITGMIENDAWVKEYSDKYPNIQYHGCVSYDEYLAILHRTPFLLSTRNPAFPENQCNFPSKIIEALLHNRIIVSTLHYEQLGDIRYLQVPSEETAFVDAIQQIAHKPDDELLTFANQSEQVRLMFSVEEWNRVMNEIENGKLG